MSCYNASSWLAEAIDSVLAQTFGNFEFVLVDDGSTDETWSIIQNYHDRDERIVAITKKNTGLADSLNLGITHAKGKWIARLDADDLCESTRLEEQVNFVRNHPEVVLLGTGFLEVDEKGRVVKEHRYPSSHSRLVRNLERLQRFFPHSSAFYRTEIVKQVKGYSSRIHRAEDYRLWLELSLRGEISCLIKPLVRIRKHTGQISHEDNGRRQLCDAIAATTCHFLRKFNYKDPSMEENNAEWIEFLNWVERRVEESHIFERQRYWIEARANYFSERKKLTGIIRFIAYLVKFGHIGLLLREKLAGSSLPRHLAEEWMVKIK